MDSQFLGSAVEMLILEVIAQGPSYGYEITQTVSERSNGYFELKEGSLYPALHRLERQKLLRAFWREADGRRRKYYDLTDAGRAELAAQDVVARLRGGRQRRPGRRAGPPGRCMNESPRGGTDRWTFSTRSPPTCLGLGTMSRPGCARTSSTSWPTTWPARTTASSCEAPGPTRRGGVCSNGSATRRPWPAGSGSMR